MSNIKPVLLNSIPPWQYIDDLAGRDEREEEQSNESDELSNNNDDSNPDDEYVEFESSDIVFPYIPFLNSKISLWFGNLWELDVDAIVVPTNSSFSYRNVLVGKVLSAAGDEVLEDLDSFRYSKVGDVAVVNAGDLPSRQLMFCVAPKFLEQYKIASENALHCCYRNSLSSLTEMGYRTIAFSTLYSQRKGFTLEKGAHIAIRTVRRFLENWGDKIDRIIFAINDDMELISYANILPLYFPRSIREEDIAVENLPDDVGNEFGETEIDERKIRINPFPNFKANVADVSLDRPHSSFTEILSNPDERAGRKQLVHPELAQLSNEEIQYNNQLARARKADLSDIATLQIIYQSGHDEEGRPIIIIVGHRLPENQEKMNRAYYYMIRMMDSIVDEEYIVIYLHTNMEERRKPSMNWLKTVYHTMHAKYNENLFRFYILHPSFWLKLVKSFFSTFVRSDFLSKVRYMGRTSDLMNHFDISELGLPEEIYHYEKEEHILGQQDTTL